MCVLIGWSSILIGVCLLFSQLIGCNVSQLFKKKVPIRDLPKLEINKTNRSPPDILNSNDNDNSLARLFNS